LASPEGVELTAEDASEPLLADIGGVEEPSDALPPSDNPAIPGHLDASLDAPDPVAQALAKALDGATAAGRWDVVAQLAGEVEARRLARTGNVIIMSRKVNHGIR
jgi:hypothetical protein